jgi:hypothetical protein
MLAGIQQARRNCLVLRRVQLIAANFGEDAPPPSPTNQHA